MPFALLALHRCLRTGRGVVAVALTTSLVTLSSVYYAYFFALALAVLLPAAALLRWPVAPGGWPRALAGLAIAAVVTAAAMVPYLIARDIYAFARASGEAWFFAGKAINYLGAVTDPVRYAVRRYGAGESLPVVIGLGTFVLLLVGLATGAPRAHGGRRTTTAYLAVAIWLAFVSLGPLLQWENLMSPSLPGVWHALAAALPGFAALRVLMRAGAVVVLAAAVVAGLGADALWRRAHGRAARAVLLVLFAAVGVLESWRPSFGIAPMPWGDGGVPPVYGWLARQPGRDAVLEIPIGIPLPDAAAMALSAAHWKPIVNGHSGFAPTMSFFRAGMFGFPTPPMLRVLREIGVRWVVVHVGEAPPAQAALCGDPARIAPHMALAYRDATSCVLEVRSAPPAPPTPADRPVELAGATATTASGADAAAAIDGRLDTSWTEPVEARTEGRLRLDLPAPHLVSRLVLELGPRFGDYLRHWRVETSLDGVAWTVAATERNATPPLAQMRTTPSALSTELRLPRPMPARHIQIVRMKTDPQTAYDLWANWTQWGVHELRVFEAAP
jgi:hypothetical protein